MERPLPPVPLLHATLLFAALAVPAPAAPMVVAVRNGPVQLTYDRRDGTATLAWAAGAAIRGFHAEAALPGRTVSSRDYDRRSITRRAGELVVTHEGDGLPRMRQRFSLRPNGAALLTLEIAGEALSSNRMAPIVAPGPASVRLGGAADARALRVPFDNDQWARYHADPIAGAGTSYGVAAFFDNDTRRGLVVGAVTHDTWKTGIEYKGAADGRAATLNTLRAFGGIADAGTRDVAPHGSVTGATIVSPTIIAMGVNDWRDGMEAFAEENAARRPMLPWRGGPPFGWNSWGKVQTRLDYDTAAAVSDAFAGGLPGGHFQNDGVLYINLDSYWDNLSDAELRRFVARVRGNGQRPGIYWGPFVYWGSDLARPVEGSAVRFDDIVLRPGPNADPIRLDGAYALDPTHPATIGRTNAVIDRFKAAGFEYIKLDFLTHGALEGGLRSGRRHDPSVETGIQAYHHGMRRIVERLDGTMFISASIAPVFPHGYAHARRISCDTYGSIGETEYVMNSIGYGWWISGRLYAFNDPDHIVLAGHTPDENMARVTSGAIAGTVFLNGDDVTNPDALRRVRTFMANRAINDVARLGRAFRPVEGNTGDRAPDVMALRHGEEAYLAIFNYDGNSGADRSVDLVRAGLSPAGEYTVTDLWTGRVRKSGQALNVTLRPGQGTLLKITPDRVPDRPRGASSPPAAPGERAG